MIFGTMVDGGGGRDWLLTFKSTALADDERITRLGTCSPDSC